MAILLFFSVASPAQTWIPLGSVDSTVPPLRTIIGHDLGERFTDFRLMERAIEELARHSRRVKVETYGSSYEHRPLRVLIVTSVENHRRLDAIREDNLRLTDPRTLSAAEADRITRDLPAIVWISAGVHGNESSSPEAVLALAYQLAAGTDDRTTAILRDAVVVLDPTLNPDGRERYVQWYHRTATDPPTMGWDGAEHAEPWPGGRTNHYLFDLNRDWAWLTQQESQARIALFRRWMPHTHIDLHEMGAFSSYFFFPAAAPFHEALPADAVKWGAIYGAANASALDRIGAPYYVGENFDMFYPGYGDSWPTFNGAIGMTYEQAGSGRAGLAIRRPDGTLLTLGDRIRNHFATSFSTL
ncbi:MAG: M14 family zinc carboxypeptidase [Bacteroidota bacterium]